jgi:hypothetical protein
MPIENHCSIPIEVKAQLVYENLLTVTEAMRINHDPRIGRLLMIRCDLHGAIYDYQHGMLPLGQLGVKADDIYFQLHPNHNIKSVTFNG